MFTTEYEFTAGEYSYKVEGTDVDGVQFSKDLAKSVVVENGPSDAYSFEAKDSSTLEVDSGNSFTIEFELKSNDKFGTTSFSLSSSLDGFTLTLDSTNVELQPMAVQTITLTGSNIGSAGVGVNTITVTASNGCQTLTATRQVTIKGVVNIACPYVYYVFTPRLSILSSIYVHVYLNCSRRLLYFLPISALPPRSRVSGIEWLNGMTFDH